MRDHDRAEICCQFEHWDSRVFAIAALQSEVPGMSWAVWLDGQPAAAYGFSYVTPFDRGRWQAWAFGTKDFKRCLPIMTRHLNEIRPIVEKDCRRLQAIAHVDHDVAHGWIEGFGAKREGEVRGYGRNGEDFVIYGWVRED
ncbi:hypothetical protein [uncultured Roseibium sp.]|uniref:hypothetical protein n=1 Tax=uncultured Roseibium sp. TaxID=1936171 RepID=UPI002606EDAF|nr:hypothetical protein [uncultured Roseibium sp.]